MGIKDLLGNSSFIMVLALILALIIGFPYRDMGSKIPLIVLAVMMTVSLSRISFSNLNPIKHKTSVLRALILGTLVASFIPLAASLFIDDPLYKAGLVFIGAAPFAASVVPLSFIMKGDVEHAARGTIIVYLLSIIYIPVIVKLFAGETVSILDVVGYVVILVLIPIILSRPVSRDKISTSSMQIFVNLCVAILIFVSVGSNKNTFESETSLLLIFMGIAVLRTFVLGLGLEYLEKKCGIAWEQRVPDVLMASYKNKGVAIALTMGLLPPAAAFPITASIIIEVCWVICMDRFLFTSKRREKEIRLESASTQSMDA